MDSCGRIRPIVKRGLTPVVDRELDSLKLELLWLESGDKHSLDTEGREYAVILLSGFCDIRLMRDDVDNIEFGPRLNPFQELPHALFISRDEKLLFTSRKKSIIALGSSPAAKKFQSGIIRPEDVRCDKRGADNWEREVRFVCWSDNTEGNRLLASETLTPSGNWSTIPPHRHQHNRPGEEAPYEEIYYYQFSRSTGFALIWQFDDEGNMDQAFSLKNNDAAYMKTGYHPVANGPGSTLYQLTLMSGPRRISKARIHDEYAYLMKEQGLANQYVPEVKG